MCTSIFIENIYFWSPCFTDAQLLPQEEEEFLWQLYWKKWPAAFIWKTPSKWSFSWHLSTSQEVFTIHLFWRTEKLPFIVKNNWEITYFELMLRIYLMLTSHLERFNHSLHHIMCIYRYIIQKSPNWYHRVKIMGKKQKKRKWTVPKSINLFTSTFWIDIHFQVNI